MYSTVRDTLQSILEIIHYPNNKEKFISEFEQVTYEEALLNVVGTLPQHIQQQLKRSSTPEDVLQYIPQKILSNEYIHVANNALGSLLASLSVRLNKDQKQKIMKLLQQ